MKPRDVLDVVLILAIIGLLIWNPNSEGPAQPTATTQEKQQ